MATAKVDVLDGGRNEQESDSNEVHKKFERYAVKKTIAQGMLDIGLLMANASQLKSLISVGPDEDYYYANMVLISVSIVLQIIVGLVLMALGSMKAKPKDGVFRAETWNNVATVLIFVITVVNVFIAAFGIKLQEDSN